MVTDEGTWELHFDGSANRRGCGIGIVISSPEGDLWPIAVRLGDDE